MSTPVDTSTAHAIADTVFLVTRDTLYIDRADTLVAALHSQRDIRSITIALIPSVLALLSFYFVVRGWKVAHRNANRQFHAKVVHDAAHAVSESFMNYYLWLLNVSGALDKLYAEGRFDGRYRILLDEIIDSDVSNRWATVAQSNKYTLWGIMPDLGVRAAALLPFHNEFMTKAIFASDSTRGTDTDRADLARQASNEIMAQCDYVHDLREDLVVLAHNFVFPDYVVVRDQATPSGTKHGGCE